MAPSPENADFYSAIAFQTKSKRAYFWEWAGTQLGLQTDPNHHHEEDLDDDGVRRPSHLRRAILQMRRPGGPFETTYSLTSAAVADVIILA